MTSEMFDSIDPAEIPAGQDAAGYVDGRWPTFTALHGPHNLSIAVFAADDADALDDEPGDATNAQVAAWVHRELGLGHWRPCVYTSISNVAAVLAVLAAAGIDRSQVRLWTAHYTYNPHVCAEGCAQGLPAGFCADATQWTDRSGGRNLDESTVADDFFAPAPTPPPAPQPDPTEDPMPDRVYYVYTTTGRQHIFNLDRGWQIPVNTAGDGSAFTDAAPNGLGLPIVKDKFSDEEMAAIPVRTGSVA